MSEDDEDEDLRVPVELLTARAANGGPLTSSQRKPQPEAAEASAKSVSTNAAAQQGWSRYRNAAVDVLM